MSPSKYLTISNTLLDSFTSLSFKERAIIALCASQLVAASGGKPVSLSTKKVRTLVNDVKDLYKIKLKMDENGSWVFHNFFTSIEENYNSGLMKLVINPYLIKHFTGQIKPFTRIELTEYL